MKLYQIYENEYAGLEDTDEFGPPEELVAMLKLKNWIENNWHSLLWKYDRKRFTPQEFEGTKPTISNHLDKILMGMYGEDVYYQTLWETPNSEPSHEDLELAYTLIQSNPDLTEWWESFAEMPERLEPVYGRYQEELPDSGDLTESEYDDLEDVDEFSDDPEETWLAFIPDASKPSQYAVVYYDNGGIPDNEVITAISEALGTQIEAYDLSDESGGPIEPMSIWNVPYYMGYFWVRLRSELPSSTTAEGEIDGKRWIVIVENPLANDQLSVWDFEHLEESSEYDDLEDVDEFSDNYNGPTNIGGFNIGPHQFEIWEYTNPDNDDHPQDSTIEISIDRWDNLGEIPEQLKLNIKNLLRKFIKAHSRDLLYRIDPKASLNEWIYQAAMLVHNYINHGLIVNL